MPEQAKRHTKPADVVRDLLAADAHTAWGDRTAAELEERGRGLAAEARRIRESASATARRLGDAAASALAAHPEWADDVRAGLERATGGGHNGREQPVRRAGDREDRRRVKEVTA